MAVEVTLRLPEDLVEHTKRFGEVTERIPDVTTLTGDVLTLADTTMDSTHNDRLAALQSRGQAEGLTATEQAALFKL